MSSEKIQLSMVELMVQLCGYKQVRIRLTLRSTNSLSKCQAVGSLPHNFFFLYFILHVEMVMVVSSLISIESEEIYNVRLAVWEHMKI